MRSINKDFNTKMYVGGISIAIMGEIVFLLMKKMQINIFGFFPECYFHKYTGYFCFGCGSTRAMQALIKGNILKSLYYNADIGYLCFVYACFMVSYTLMLITKGKIHVMRIRPLYGYLLIALSILQCIFKNAMAFWFDVWLL